jgi:hypothetical protein
VSALSVSPSACRTTCSIHECLSTPPEPLRSYFSIRLGGSVAHVYGRSFHHGAAERKVTLRSCICIDVMPCRIQAERVRGICIEMSLPLFSLAKIEISLRVGFYGKASKTLNTKNVTDPFSCFLDINKM